ncbi:hypothetical protein TNCV_2445451 [Trichonephila clavipes]|nr:hypothetical protein TNCV_2445451 [Trichonephila clavipes]
MQGDQLCVHPSRAYLGLVELISPAYLGLENTFPGPDSDGLLYSFMYESRFTLESDYDVCSTGGNKAPDIISPTLLKDTVTEVVE